MPDTARESAPDPFVACYSVSRLLGWAALSGGMGAAGLFMAVTGGSTFALLVGGAGTLFFGGIAALLALRLFDRRPQVVIDAGSIYVRSHGDARIPLRSIRTMRTDVITPTMTKLCLYLHKPGKYPIGTRHRRFIARINGEAGTRAFFGDVWIWQAHLDQPVDAIIRAIWAHRPATEFEKRMWAIEDAASPGSP